MGKQLKSCQKPKRVLHIVYSMNYGGVETFLMSMLRCYDRERFHMDILYTGPCEGGYGPQVRALGANLIPCRLGREQIRFVYRLYKLLRREKYDAVNNHIGDLGGGVMFAAWLAGVSSRVASYHTRWVDSGFLRNLYLRIMRCIVTRLSTNITVSSPVVGESYFGGLRVRANMILPISYGVNSVFFAEKPARTLDIKQFGFNEDNVIVGHIGSYRPQKNHMALLRIAKEVIQDVPNARFLLCGSACGDGDFFTRYKVQIDQEIVNLGLSNYLAQVSGFADIREFFSAIDVFILPSKHEGMPVSIIEAQAGGKPVVASRIEGIEIATAPEMRGHLFAIDDIEHFSGCVVGLLKDKDKRDILGKAGQKFVREHLDIKVAVKRFEELY